MHDPSKTPSREVLARPLQYLKGAGPARGELLAKMGLTKVRDALFHFPRDYEVVGEIIGAGNLHEGVPATIEGVVEEVAQHVAASGNIRLGVLLRSQATSIRATWYNQPYLRDKIVRGRRILVSGKPRRRGDRWEFVQPRWQVLVDDEPLPPGRLLPVYPLTEGLRQWQMRKVVRAALATAADCVPEVFPREYLAAKNLLSIGDALRLIHFPSDMEQARAARRRFVFQELLLLQLALASRRLRLLALGEAPPLECTAKIDARIRRLLPFELTPGQKQAIREIVVDLAKPIPMGRLLQGDVGSGKTVVAAYAALVAVAHAHQVAIMAPTEILARQHRETFGQLLEGSRVRLGLLTGSLTGAERDTLLSQLRQGDVDVLIGTHAVIQPDVHFARLGLVIIDEQHRFGVRQRAMLKEAGRMPHYLVMTATPIPRSLALALFGDLEVSILRGHPPGRQGVHTYLAEDHQRGAWWEFVRGKLREGRQAYVVAPAIRDSAALDVANLKSLFESLANGELEAFRLGLLHGAMPPMEKKQTMEAFRRGDIQVLVCTSVIEVGIDVPNATLLTIEGADRFGLAQLHQLRGRIIRGTQPGYCCCFSQVHTPAVRERLEAFAKTTDGFALAELDFRLRGPGELLGTRQHGLPPLRIADLARDQQLLEEAREFARDLVRQDPGLCRPEHARLRSRMLQRYGRAWELGEVG